MRYISFLLFLITIASCARVPKQSIELSATVGRDIVQMHASHKETAQLLFSRMKEDVNHFVDEVYAPFQLQKLLKADLEDFNRQDNASLFFAMHTATDSTDLGKQKEALEMMQYFVQFIRNDVESYRKELLAPILKQEEEVLSAIDRSYNQIIYANSIVTGHLASVRKVHDAQEEVLNQMGLEGIREQTTAKLVEASNRLSEALEKARKINLDKTEEDLQEVKAKMETIFP